MMPMRRRHGGVQVCAPQRFASPSHPMPKATSFFLPISHIKQSPQPRCNANILLFFFFFFSSQTSYPPSSSGPIEAIEFYFFLVRFLLQPGSTAPKPLAFLPSMARKCSSCGNNGHNSRTCSGHGRTTVFENVGGGGGGGEGGVRLFGVQLHVGSSSPMAMKKCFSMECLSSAAPSVAPAYYAAAAAAALAATNSASPSASSSSSLVSVEEAPEKMPNGYLSDGLMGRAQERKKGVPWTEDEHRRFLAGLEKLGKGDWRGISRHFVTTRTPTQVASHAQKYFLRQSSLTHKKRRSSLFDVVENADRAAAASSINNRERLRLKDAIVTTASAAAAPGTTTAAAELPALSLGISRPATALLPPSASSLSLQLPRCSSAMGSLALAAPKHKHPSSTLAAAATDISSSSQAALPDLELKISTARQSDVHQVQTGSPAPARPRTTPFLGTIRVT